MMEKTDNTLPTWARILVEWGPLITFFIANAKGGIFWGTGIFMAATAIALAVSWTFTGKLALVPLIGAVFVVVFGGLTLWLQNETFIKVKVTLVNLLFGTILLSGLAFRKQFLKLVLGEALKMDDEGWRILTLRWGLFFFALALLNEIIWRTVST